MYFPCNEILFKYEWNILQIKCFVYKPHVCIYVCIYILMPNILYQTIILFIGDFQGICSITIARCITTIFYKHFKYLKFDNKWPTSNIQVITHFTVEICVFFFFFVNYIISRSSSYYDFNLFHILLHNISTSHIFPPVRVKYTTKNTNWESFRITRTHHKACNVCSFVCLYIYVLEMYVCMYVSMYGYIS